MDVQVVDLAGKEVSSLKLNESIFGADFKEALVHQVVVAYQAGGRQGSVKQKTRSEVSGGGAKPFRQKGTGRARAGTSRSPIWIGGGRAFAARPRNYEQKVNKKSYRVAIRSILSQLNREGRLIVVDSLKQDTHKTKELKDKLLKIEHKSLLLVTAECDSNLLLASRNIPHVAYTLVEHLNPLALVGYDKVVLDKDSVQKIEEWLA